MHFLQIQISFYDFISTKNYERWKEREKERKKKGKKNVYLHRYLLKFDVQVLESKRYFLEFLGSN